MEAWEKKVERMENNPRRKAKESRTREYYERQFPEIRKQREQQERFQRSGQHHYPRPEFPAFPERFPSRKFENRPAWKLVLRTRSLTGGYAYTNTPRRSRCDVTRRVNRKGTELNSENK